MRPYHQILSVVGLDPNSLKPSDARDLSAEALDQLDKDEVPVLYRIINASGKVSTPPTSVQEEKSPRRAQKRNNEPRTVRRSPAARVG